MLENILDRFESSLEAYRKGARFLEKGRVEEGEALLRDALNRFPREALVEIHPGLDSLLPSLEALYGNIKSGLMNAEDRRKGKAFSQEYDSLQTVVFENLGDEEDGDDGDLDLSSLDGGERVDSGRAATAEDLEIEPDAAGAGEEEEIDLSGLDGLDELETPPPPESDLEAELNLDGSAATPSAPESGKSADIATLEELDGLDSLDLPEETVQEEPTRDGLEAELDELPVADEAEEIGNASLEEMHGLTAAVEDGTEEVEGSDLSLEEELAQMAREQLGGAAAGKAGAAPGPDETETVPELEQIGEELTAEVPDDLGELEDEEEASKTSLGLNIEDDGAGPEPKSRKEADEMSDEEREETLEDDAPSDEEEMSEEEMRALAGGGGEEEESLSPGEMAALSGAAAPEDVSAEEGEDGGEAKPKGKSARKLFPLFRRKEKKPGEPKEKKKPAKRKSGKKSKKPAAASAQLGGFIAALAFCCAAFGLWTAFEGFKEFKTLDAPYRKSIEIFEASGDPMDKGQNLLKVVGPGKVSPIVESSGRDLYSDLIRAAEGQPEVERGLWERWPSGDLWGHMDQTYRGMNLARAEAARNVRSGEWSAAGAVLTRAEAELSAGSLPPEFAASFKGEFDRMAVPIHLKIANASVTEDIEGAYRSSLRLLAAKSCWGQSAPEAERIVGQVANRLVSMGASLLEGGDARGAAGAFEKAIAISPNHRKAANYLNEVRKRGTAL